MDDNFYRKRLEEPLDQAVLSFLSSLKEDMWIAEEDIIGTEAHNIMLYEQNILKKEEIKKILFSLEKIKEKLIKNHFQVDPKFEDIHPLIEKFVINDIGIETGGKIHTGRSRNDQVSVDLRMKLRDLYNELSKELFELVDILLKESKKVINIHIPLYTHLQRGQLGALSHYYNTYIAQILRSIERIEETYKRLNKNPLGACAIGGTSININRKRTAELLGFEGIIENSLDAISSRDYIIETLNILALISLQFSRIAEDLLIWSTKEFDFIELNDKFCSVSSVMPQKKNPDTIELIRSKTSKVISNLNWAQIIIKSIPSGYFRDFQELKKPLIESFEITFTIINLFKAIFPSLNINEEMMKNAINDSFILALDLAEILVQKFNIPFRQSHQIVADIVKQHKKPLEAFKTQNIEVAIKNVLHRSINIPDELISDLKDIEKCLELRISEGSPSKLEIKKLIKKFNENKQFLFQKYTTRLKSLEIANKKREEIIKKLIS